MSTEGRPVRGRRGRVVRLRRWLLGIAVVLMVLLASFIGYARHRARKALLDLPKLLGADIRSETNGFTYSQTVKGRTLFTIHAAKAVQRQNGKTTLHDVVVTLYGEPGSDRVDSIRGAEFEYDQPNGVVRAMGETQLDLASPAASSAAGQPQAKRISVSATGLVFLEKLGVAATEGPIRFQYGSMSGEARGADYDADTGLLELRHDVHLLSNENGRMEKVDADSAEIDRHARSAVLQQASLRDVSDTLTARTLHVDLRPEGVKRGGVQKVTGDGGITITSAKGARVQAASLLADWADGDRPRSLLLRGGVRMHAAAEGDGNAGDATLLLDSAGHPTTLDLQHDVKLVASAADGKPARVLTADTVHGQFQQQARKAVLRDLTASGSAKLVTTDPPSGSRTAAMSVLSANTIHAAGNTDGGRFEVDHVDGDGDARIEEKTSDGRIRTSSSNHLTAVLQKTNPATSAATHTAATGLASLVQVGRVVIVERRPATPATRTAQGKLAGESRATAERAEYIAATDDVLLSGSPEVTDTGVQISAATINIRRLTGDAEAQGSVHGTYLAAAGEQRSKGATSDALHFAADRFEVRREEEHATIFGGGSYPARLWNSNGQVEAPVIEVDRTSGKLVAHDAAGSSKPLAVRTVLPATAQAEPKTGSATKNASPLQAGGPLRMLSRSLVYTQGSQAAPGKADFQGGVRLDTSGGQVLADSAIATLQPASGRQDGLLSGGAQTVVAQGHVRVQQPGRSATADRLQYTTSDQSYVLTGTPGAQPVVRDSVQGSITGARLLFHAGDDSVEVAGAAPQPVHTEATVPPRKSSFNMPGRDRSVPGGSSTGQGPVQKP